MVMPKALPPVRGNEGLSLSAVSLLVVNAEKDPAEHEILTAQKEWTGFRGNRQAWAKRLVESLSRELAVRGARVRSDAPVVLSVALPEITFSETRHQFQFTVRVVVSSSVGWAKEYEGVAATSASTRSMQAVADKLAGLALADAVKKMLGDPAFLVRLGSKQ
jgi:tRNA A37 threonylcarbamoyladenosine synthetase subunit TsaC/SUA5/YrdC